MMTIPRQQSCRTSRPIRDYHGPPSQHHGKSSLEGFQPIGGRLETRSNKYYESANSTEESRMASEQTSTGKLYAALISRLENDKAELERERNFLKKELAVQAYRNRKLEKEIGELKKRDRKQTTSTRLPRPRIANVKRPVELADSDSDCSESTTTTTDTELERTPAPSPKRSPELRPVSTPQTFMPLWMALAEETVPERAGSSQEITAPQPPPLRKDNYDDDEDDIITNSTFSWDRWNTMTAVPDPLMIQAMKHLDLNSRSDMGVGFNACVARVVEVRIQ
ncbi:hypothetical protein DFP73DRAFT_600963 [Morchella snyderi]|nr:hypothetical protein DFP73DRAFT_600963 [Morchella snyderi]